MRISDWSSDVCSADLIGLAVLKRLKPFDMHLHYTDRHRLAPEVETELGLTWHDRREEMYGVCDFVTLNVPIHSEPEYMFNQETPQRLNRTSYPVKTPRDTLDGPQIHVCHLEPGKPMRH